jgi:hypothetical protein
MDAVKKQEQILRKALERVEAFPYGKVLFHCRALLFCVF